MPDKNSCACFGVAGNFTGHLEQAGEAIDFVNVKAREGAPKALFPTFIPGSGECPAFLHTFPFDSEKIIFPAGEEKLQIEPECAVEFDAVWEGDAITDLKPICFGASNDCSIRKEGAKKISLKKNWGPSSKGFSAHTIAVDSFDEKGILNRYRIASFLKREEKVFVYGEDSAVRDYSYIFATLKEWLIEKLNTQTDEGPAENIHSYLVNAGRPSRLLISVGATRYTDFGEHNFLQAKDHAIVVLYPEDKYSSKEIIKMVEEGTILNEDISVLDQEIIL